jgi:trans-aconitate methyltransferase
MSTQNEYYDRFFAHGGWKYDLAEQRRFLQRRLMPLAGWRPDDTLIEVGAGMCHHAELLRQLGLDVTAVEASSSGVEYAREHYPKLSAVCADASAWVPEQPVRHVFARGMSFFHYELTGVNCKGVDVPKETARMFEKWLEPGGTFTLQIVTNFSGAKQAVHMNRLESYLELFEPLGSVDQVTDFSGRKLRAPVRGRTDRGIIIVTRKP